ncbi:hypothetical protein BMJ29_30620 [Sinorhizobium medicae]|nr:hypothetical protein BMJ29_30620 [Sinorhizobium medicae]
MQLVAFELQFGELCPEIVERDEANEGPPARHAALSLEDLVALGLEHEVEALRLGAQSLDRFFELPRRMRLDPAAEGEKVAVVLWCAGLHREMPQELGSICEPVPDHDTPVLVGD